MEKEEYYYLHELIMYWIDGTKYEDIEIKFDTLEEAVKVQEELISLDDDTIDFIDIEDTLLAENFSFYDTPQIQVSDFKIYKKTIISEEVSERSIKIAKLNV